MYTVVICYGCGRYLLATSSQKTKRCPYCSAQLTLTKAKKVARAKTAQEASERIRVLKGRKGFAE